MRGAQIARPFTLSLPKPHGPIPIAVCGRLGLDIQRSFFSILARSQSRDQRARDDKPRDGKEYIYTGPKAKVICKYMIINRHRPINQFTAHMENQNEHNRDAAQKFYIRDTLVAGGRGGLHNVDFQGGELVVIEARTYTRKSGKFMHPIAWG